MIFDIGLIDITGWEYPRTVCTAKNVSAFFYVFYLIHRVIIIRFIRVHTDGGASWHVHQCSADDSLFIASAVDRANLAAYQVDDSRPFVLVGIVFICIQTHTQTTPCTGTEDLHISIFFIEGVGYVDEHVAAVLQLVAVGLSRLSLSGSEDSLHRVLIVLVGGTEIHEGVVEIGLVEDGDWITMLIQDIVTAFVLKM